jgi:hypothetical protein
MISGSFLQDQIIQDALAYVQENVPEKLRLIFLRLQTRLLIRLDKELLHATGHKDSVSGEPTLME